MVHHRLRERLARRRGAEVAVEAEGLHDGEVRLDREHRRSGPLLLGEDLAATLVEARVDAADRVFGALDLDCGAKESEVRREKGEGERRRRGSL